MDVIVGLGKVLGLAGASIGLFVFLFREIISKKIFPNLTKKHAYNIIRLFMLAVWSIALLGIILWFQDNNENSSNDSKKCKKLKEESRALLQVLQTAHSNNNDKYDDIKFIALESMLENNISLTTCDSLNVIIEDNNTVKNFLKNYEK